MNKELYDLVLSFKELDYEDKTSEIIYEFKELIEFMSEDDSEVFFYILENNEQLKELESVDTIFLYLLYLKELIANKY